MNSQRDPMCGVSPFVFHMEHVNAGVGDTGAAHQQGVAVAAVHAGGFFGFIATWREFLLLV